MFTDVPDLQRQTRWKKQDGEPIIAGSASVAVDLAKGAFPQVAALLPLGCTIHLRKLFEKKLKVAGSVDQWTIQLAHPNAQTTGTNFTASPSMTLPGVIEIQEVLQ